jgi:tetratricopeptide (TPR) repeat protein
MKKQLEEIRDTAISGRYVEALASLDVIMERQPKHVEALRLKGNVLELKALDRAQYESKKLLRSRDFVAARKCYETILLLDPENTLALIDLGDHFRNLGASEKALEYYESAISLLQKGRFRWSKKEEIEDVCKHATELYAALGREADETRVERIRRALTSLIRARQSRRRLKQSLPKRRR